MRMTRLYSGLLIASALAAVSLAACSGSSSTPPTAAKTQTLYVGYTAIGASDAVGYGASVPCANPPTIANPTCPGGTGYVPDLVNLFTKAGANVTLNDLGISGAVVGPDILSLVNMYGAVGTSDACQPRTQGVDAYPADFITNELPNVTGKETLITIFAGGNDTNGIANAAACLSATESASQVQAFVTNEITAFGSDLFTLVAQVHAKAPSAKIVVANLPNFSQIPVGQAQSAAAQQLLAAISVGIDLDVIDNNAPTYGIPVVDLLCNPQSYVPANFYTDGFHPDDAGYAAFAAAFYAQITATTPAAPSTTCSYVSASARTLSVPIRPFPDFSRGKH